MNLDNSNEKVQETHELPTGNVHGTISQQPSAEKWLISTEMFAVALFEWPEFFDAEFIAIVTKADEILDCILEALQSNKLNKMRDFGSYFTNYLDKLHTLNGILEDDVDAASLMGPNHDEAPQRSLGHVETEGSGK